MEFSKTYSESQTLPLNYTIKMPLLCHFLVSIGCMDYFIMIPNVRFWHIISSNRCLFLLFLISHSFSYTGVVLLNSITVLGNILILTNPILNDTKLGMFGQ